MSKKKAPKPQFVFPGGEEMSEAQKEKFKKSIKAKKEDKISAYSRPRPKHLSSKRQELWDRAFNFSTSTSGFRTSLRMLPRACEEIASGEG